MKDQAITRIEIVEVSSEGWKTLRRAMPDRAVKGIALRLHVHPDHARRWRREPLSDETPLSSGQRSPLDRTCDLIDAIFLTHPAGAALIVEHVKSHYEQLIEASAFDLLGPQWDRRAHAATVLREAVEAVNCLNLDAPDEDTIEEIVQARNELDRALAGLRARSRENNHEAPPS